jgi:hypothetical protein
VRNIRVIAKRSDIDADTLSDAISALEAGDLNDDQANLLRTVVDRATGVVVDDPTAPMSILKDKLSLYEKFLSL